MGPFGRMVNVVGPSVVERAALPTSKAPPPIESDEGSQHDLARTLGRRIGRGGGMRDPMRNTDREKYVSVSVSRHSAEIIRQQAEERGLSVAAFLGMIVEGALKMDEDALDDLFAAEP